MMIWVSRLSDDKSFRSLLIFTISFDAQEPRLRKVGYNRLLLDIIATLDEV
jgi:hypothetical protein